MASYFGSSHTCSPIVPSSTSQRMPVGYIGLQFPIIKRVPSMWMVTATVVCQFGGKYLCYRVAFCSLGIGPDKRSTRGFIARLAPSGQLIYRRLYSPDVDESYLLSSAGRLSDDGSGRINYKNPLPPYMYCQSSRLVIPP